MYGYHGAIHMSRETFGPDADSFRPERFIEDDGKFKPHPHILVKFSHRKTILLQSCLLFS